MTLHVDLSDVAAHASSCQSLTGIQRVQLEYVRFIVRKNDRKSKIFADLYGADVDLGPLFHAPDAGSDAVMAQMRLLFGPASAGRSCWPLAETRAKAALKLRWAGGVLRRAAGGSRRRFGPSDCLYVGGAFWAHPPSVRTYERAARDGCDVAILFHDVLPVAAPDLADPGCRPLFERMLRLRARAITVSRHSQAQIESARRALGAADDLPPATIVPLAHEFAAAPRNFVAGGAPTLRAAALQGRSFALCVGTVEPRKNQLPLIRLWERLAREMGPDWPRLVVAGKPGWRCEETLRALKAADAASPHVWIEAPTDDELAWLYGRARLTVFPSLAEGWGLPIGESLWFGKPCVASNAASMPEVGGALCAYANPRRIETFAEPIIRLVRDADHYHASVAAIRASRLRTWEETAEALLDASAPLRADGGAGPQRRASRARGSGVPAAL